MSRDATIEQILIRHELHELALRYAQSVDRRRYAGFREIFTEKGSIHGHRADPATSKPLFSIEGRETIVESMSRIEQYLKTQHHVTNQLVEIDGERASGETYCTAHHIYLKDDKPWNLTMAIRYQDKFVRESDRWYFEERRLWIDCERHESLGEEGWA